MFVSGGGFTNIPGDYMLPKNEGRCKIYHCNDTYGEVAMITRTSGQIYRHPLVEIKRPTRIIDYGWYN